MSNTNTLKHLKMGVSPAYWLANSIHDHEIVISSLAWPIYWLEMVKSMPGMINAPISGLIENKKI
jgi:hypothetical protein